MSGDGVTEYVHLQQMDLQENRLLRDEGELKWVDKKKLTDSIYGKDKYSSDSGGIEEFFL